MDLMASKEHTFGDQIDWTNPHARVPLNIKHNHAHIGMFAAQHGYDDVLDQWFRDGSDPRQEANLFGIYIHQCLTCEPSEGGYRCLERWSQALRSAGEDINTHGETIYMHALSEIAYVQYRHRQDAATRASAPLPPVHCALAGLFNPPEDQPQALAPPCPPPHASMSHRVVIMMLNHGFTIFSLSEGVNSPVWHHKDTGPTMKDTVGSVVASLPANPEDHGLIVTQALLHRMGYDVPHRDDAMEEASMRTPIGAGLAQRFVMSINDPIVLANWLSFLDM
jgi:hypothetical protein